MQVFINIGTTRRREIVVSECSAYFNKTLRGIGWLDIKKKTKIVISTVCLLLALGIVIAIIDFGRVHSFEKPIFCVATVIMQDGGSGHYMGLGCSFDIKVDFMPLDEFPSVTEYTYYILGQKISSEVRD